MQLVLQLTRDCNFACTYCYQTHSAGRGMTPEVAEAAVERLLDAGHAHVAITFFGGEPLLERETLEACWPALRELGARRGALVTAKVCTNGALLDRSLAEFARRTGLFVSLSVDGGPDVQDTGRPTVDGHSTSALAENALERLRVARAPFATYQVITPANAAVLARSTEWLLRRGSRVFVSTLDFGAPWTPADLRRLGVAYRGLARRYVRWTRRGETFFMTPFDAKITARTQGSRFGKETCCAGVRQIAVDPDGGIYPCIEFLESPKWKIGDVASGIDPASLASVYHDHGGSRPEECGDCGIRSRCASNCACLNLRVGGEMHSIDALLCAHERLVTQAADRIGRRLFQKRDRTFLDRHYNPWHQPLAVLESIFEETAS
ncbi:MAG: hypothetical protein CMJ83_21095 [Planctomycetes bacterium]|nr:hypothetical protein [Planctomycetota bacterium]